MVVPAVGNPEFGGDKEFVSCDAAIVDSFADCLFIAIRSRRIQ